MLIYNKLNIFEFTVTKNLIYYYIQAVGKLQHIIYLFI